MTSARSLAGAIVASLAAMTMTATAVAQGRIDDLLAKMTLEEKAGQMTMLTLQAVSSEAETATTKHKLNEEALREAVADRAIGFILNQYDAAFTPDYWREIVGKAQTLAVEDSRLGVPLVYAVDSVHGANYVRGATLFPQNLTLAATWNPRLAREAAKHTAIETRACGITWNFAPVGDVARQPLWSRYFETFGEDPTLVSTFAAATVEGMQGASLSSPNSVAACAKHFLAYSMPFNGKDRTPTHIGPITLEDVFVPPFEAMFDADVATLMVNSGEIDGVPVHASKPLLTDRLRDRMGYDGVVVTDWEDILKLSGIHRVAKDDREATRQAIAAGIDVSMVPLRTDFIDHVVSLVEAGELSEARIDESVRRILRLKEQLGVFERPMPQERHQGDMASPAARAASLSAAREGVTLLRNSNSVLPLGRNQSILVVGPTADALPPLFGGWSYSWQGTDERLYPASPTVVDALQARFGEDAVTYLDLGGFGDWPSANRVAEAAAEADIVILCLGEAPSVEKPGDIVDLDLSAEQVALSKMVIDAGKPIVTLLIENRPRTISDVEDGFDAVVWAGHPGPYGPQAIAEILAGDVNPSGRLPFTYPRHSGAIVTYDRKSTQDLGLTFQMDAYDPLFTFGSGLSYTAFGYSDLDVSVSGDAISVSVDVANLGRLDGAEVVQLYVRDEVATVTPHHERLKAFSKVGIAVGESRTVSFTLSRDDLTMVNQSAERVFEPGEFTFRIGELQETLTIE